MHNTVFYLCILSRQTRRSYHLQHHSIISSSDLPCFCSIWPVPRESTCPEQIEKQREATDTHTHNRFMTLWILSGTTRVSWYQKKHSPTHLTWSSIIPYQLSLSITIHGILPIQFTCLTVFCHSLSPSFLHFIFHTFLHSIIVFFSQNKPTPSQRLLM